MHGDVADKPVPVHRNYIMWLEHHPELETAVLGAVERHAVSVSAIAKQGARNGIDVSVNSEGRRFCHECLCVATELSLIHI